MKDTRRTSDYTDTLAQLWSKHKSLSLTDKSGHNNADTLPKFLSEGYLHSISYVREDIILVKLHMVIVLKDAFST